MPQIGEKHHCAKLSEAKVRAMRYLYWVRHIDCRCLTRLYKLSPGNCWEVVNYVTWKHVKDRFTADQIVRREAK